jgi:hypothetical protein
MLFVSIMSKMETSIEIESWYLNVNICRPQIGVKLSLAQIVFIHLGLCFLSQLFSSDFLLDNFPSG